MLHSYQFKPKLYLKLIKKKIFSEGERVFVKRISDKISMYRRNKTALTISSTRHIRTSNNERTAAHQLCADGWTSGPCKASAAPEFRDFCLIGTSALLAAASALIIIRCAQSLRLWLESRKQFRISTKLNERDGRWVCLQCVFPAIGRYINVTSYQHVEVLILPIRTAVS